MPPLVELPRTVDLNADLGEIPGDLALIGVVTSANVACGGHAGDGATMGAACGRAADAGVAIGAHPGYPDRESMGRAELGWPAADVAALVEEQVGRLAAAAAGAGGRVRYVKLHGALYHRAGRDEELAEELAAVLARIDAGLAVLAEPGSRLLGAAGRRGLATASEGYCDRGYAPGGGLVPRGQPGALLTEPGAAAEQAASLALRGGAAASDGSWLELPVRSLCLHGDTPGALALAEAVRARLEAEGVELAPFAG